MNVLIAGGTGFIGSALMRSLIADKHRVIILTRNPLAAHIPLEAKAIEWDGRTCESWLDVFEEADAVINLVGATIGQPFWTEDRKKVLVNSRVDAGLALSQAFQKVAKKPSVLVQASGVGYYGIHHGLEPLNEDTPPGDDFLASLAVQWESSTKVVNSLGVRRVIIRSGIVLGNKGILPLMSLPVRMLAGGPVGNGKQGVSWISLMMKYAPSVFCLKTKKPMAPIT